ncbi:MAG: winged helix-turn-helix transcriptional regulator [Clostridia bacterium]|nr:winged helix-turn-helix transcriptional regulator [Clostridia bacterium]
MRKESAKDGEVQEAIQLFSKLTPIFQNLSDINRQKIILTLGTYDQLNVNQLEGHIPLSRPAISHHLKNLKQAGLVDSEKRGTENYYFLTLKTPVHHMRTLMDLIEHTCELR